MEWDVWIDPKDAANLDSARIAHGQPRDIWASRGLEHIPGDVTKGSVSPGEWVTRFRTCLIKAGRLAANAMADPQDAEVSPRASYLKDVGVFLDVKSGWSTPEEIETFMEAITKQTGAKILGVGSFHPDQLEGLDGPEGVDAITFFHGPKDFINAWDFEEAAEEHTKIKRPIAMMNLAGCVTDLGEVEDELVSEVGRVAKENGIAVGGYFQEKDVSPEVEQALHQLVRDHQNVFSYGIADGTLPETPGLMDGQGWGGQDSLDG